MKEEQLLKLMKAHKIGTEDARKAFVVIIKCTTSLTEEQKKHIINTLNHLVVLPTSIVREFPNG